MGPADGGEESGHAAGSGPGGTDKGINLEWRVLPSGGQQINRAVFSPYFEAECTTLEKVCVLFQRIEQDERILCEQGQAGRSVSS